MLWRRWGKKLTFWEAGNDPVCPWYEPKDTIREQILKEKP